MATGLEPADGSGADLPSERTRRSRIKWDEAKKEGLLDLAQVLEEIGEWRAAREVRDAIARREVHEGLSSSEASHGEAEGDAEVVREPEFECQHRGLKTAGVNQGYTCIACGTMVTEQDALRRG